MTKRVLVVDDEPQICTAIESALSAEGYQVGIAGNAVEALVEFALCEAASVDLLITDQRMPGNDGLWLIAAVRKICPRLPCLLISAINDPEMEAWARRQGRCAFLAKPLRLGPLREQVAALLDGVGEKGVEDDCAVA